MMISNSNDTKLTEKKITKKELNSVFWRSMTYNASFNYERQLNVGWTFSLMPVLRKLYGDDQEEMTAALQRHLEFNNITPFICTILFGITAALEEENANDESFDVDTINAVKVGLMGPLSGIGDSIFFGTIRTIAAGLGCSLALQGSIAGPILFFLIFNIPNFLSRYFLMGYGYRLGTSFLDRVEKSGVMGKVFHGTAILGLMVIGAMVSQLVKVPLAITIGDVSLLDMFNSIVPNLLSLLITILIYQILKKDVKITNVLFGIIFFSILGAAIGIF